MIFLIFSVFKLIDYSDKSISLIFINNDISNRTIISIPDEYGFNYELFNGEKKLSNDLLRIIGTFDFRKRKVLIIEIDTTKIKNYDVILINFNFKKNGCLSLKQNRFYDEIVLNQLNSSNNRRNSVSIKLKDGIRISVDSSGIYKLTHRMLLKNNINFSPPISEISLKHKDKTVPVDVYDIDGDNIFNNNDYLIFYAEDYKSDFDTLDYYWLKIGEGKHYIHINTEESDEVLNFFQDSICIDKEKIFSRSSGCWFYEQDTFFTFLFDTINWYDNSGIIRIKLYNNSLLSQNINLYVNDLFIKNLNIQGQSFQEIQCTTNVKIKKINIKSQSFIYLKDLRIFYKRKFISDGKILKFKSEKSNFKVTINNFQSNRINIMRIDGYKIVNPVIETDKECYSVTFSDTTNGKANYIVYLTGTERIPKDIRYFNIEDKMNSFNGSDAVVITHPIFYDYALNYKNYYESYDSISVSIFTTDEIYNCFNYGEKSPFAIKDFLRYCFELDNPPYYLIIMGKGTYDPKNIYKNNSDLVPVIMKNVLGGYYSSDFEYSKICGNDEFPDIVVGRIPAITRTEMAGYIDKIINGSNSDEPKENRLFFGADYALQNSDVISEQIIKSIIPSGYDITRVYSREGTSVWEEVIRALSYGQTIFNFHGHGGEEDLGAGRYFRIYDIPRLTNYGKLTFMLAFSCVNGIMDDPQLRSVSEYSVMFPGVGMIGSVAPSGLTYFSDNIHTDKFLLNGIFRKDLRRLGDIIFYYKFLFPDSYNSICYHLIGDPLFKLKIAKDTLKFSNLYKNDTLYIRCENSMTGRFHFKVIDSLNIYEYSFNKTGYSKDTSFYIELLSENTRIISLLKNNLYSIAGEDNVFKKDIFESIIYYPEILCLNDTINIKAKLKIQPDSIFCVFGYDGILNNKIFMNDSSGTYYCRIPIIKEGLNLNFRIELFDSLNFNRSRIFSEYIIKRSDLKFLTEPEIFCDNKTLLLRLNVINSGEKKADSTVLSIYKFKDDDYYWIYDTIISDIKPLVKEEVLIPIEEFVNDTFKDINFKIFIDSYNWINELNENNNVIYYIKKKNFYKINHLDTNIISDRFWEITILPETFKKDGYFFVFEDEYEPPLKQEDFKPGSFDNFNKVFKIIYYDTIQKPFFLKIFPDSSNGSIYIRKKLKWINLSGDSVWVKDTGFYTYGFTSDNTKPIVKILKDTLYSKDGNIKINLTAEDDNGIDIWIRKPYFMINQKEIILEVNETRDLNIMNLNLESSLNDGFYNAKFFAYDVHGNMISKDIFINIQTPFLITFLSNYPNPARDLTKFLVELTKKPDSATLEIYQPSGNIVCKKVFYDLKEGKNIIEWHLRDDNGNYIPNGVYLYVVRAKLGIFETKEKRKMAVLKR